MTLYEKLVDMKYRQGVPTFELFHRFPGHVERVSEIALLDIPENMLKEVVQEKDLFQRLICLKKRFQRVD